MDFEQGPNHDFLAADIGATPFGLNSLGGLAGLESLGLGQSTFMDLQVRLILLVFIKFNILLCQFEILGIPLIFGKNLASILVV